MGEQRRLSPGEVDDALVRLRGWRHEDGRLRWERKFRNFVDAFGFMTRVALVAEALDHHPDWRNSWATVSIELVTHDAGGLTTRDLQLAERISALADEPPPRAS